MEIITAALALYLVQLLLPNGMARYMGVVDRAYLFGARDAEPKKMPETILRARRAASNMQESIPVFLALAVLGIMQNAAMMEAAAIWLALRIIYVPLYIAGTNIWRTLVWGGSLICLIMMVVALL